MKQSDYIKMQRRFYERPNAKVEDIVGAYPFHESFPYETHLLYKYGDVRKPIFDDLSNKKAFDIACGEGRMIRRMQELFGLGCDGADISEKMVAAARERCKGSNVYVTSGENCGDAAADSYDFAFCTISLQHIASYSVRRNIIKDLIRILKHDGKITLQLLMSKHYPYLLRNETMSWEKLDLHYEVDTQHAGYFEDKYDAEGTNSACDSIIGSNDISRVVNDFQSLFKEVDIWFHDISIGRHIPGIRERKLPFTHPNSHMSDLYHGTHFVFIHGSGIR